MYFLDRKEAGKKLAKVLKESYKGEKAVIFGLPRGGVVVAAEVAKVLKSKLYVVITRKIGHPVDEEYAVAAISEHGHLIHNTQEIHRLGKVWLAKAICQQEKEIQARKKLYKIKKLPSLKGRIAILVDDGIATGLTMKAAIADIKDLTPEHIVVAVPIVVASVANELREEVDTLITLQEPQHLLGGIGSYYENFPQISHEEVVQILLAEKK
ncbi:MAG TPA: phosphoribosyltransferase family protein [Patescibacteria group bacterium]|nr:phosphoribosyltransferase family protein [Patescibacteria group bacterium]